jgi:PIN domain nuclease of toxin-antitoxin system
VTRACIDTHALIWYLSQPRRLARGAARLLRSAEAGRAEILIPALVAVELSLIRESGRKTVGVPELEALLAGQPAFKMLPFDLPQAREFSRLLTMNDPFDRMIVAAARTSASTLITADVEVHESRLVEIVWD